MDAMPVSHHLLIVDGDHDEGERLAEQLSLWEEFVIRTAEGASAANRQSRDARVDLVVIDAGSTGLERCESVKLMRRSGLRCPIIMLSDHGADGDIVLCLEAGANDYVVKPFSLMVLLARIRAQLRQYASSEDAVFQIGPYSFRPGAKLLVKANGARLKLTDKETAIIRLLIRAGQKLVSREKLLAEVWGYNAGVATHTLETHVYRLRQKLDAERSDAQLIVTERGGYRLVR